MIADFKVHRGPVTSVQFHPRELLLASGSVDKTVKFYDLERLQVVSESAPESNPIRKVLFHETSAAAGGLFAGTQELLKVCCDLRRTGILGCEGIIMWRGKS